MNRYLVLVMALSVFCSHLVGAVQPVVYSPHVAHSAVHMNMGPTGAAVWMRGYHFQVVAIDEGSPADGRLEFGDLVIGANDVLFGAETGHRRALGNAIEEAEGSGEALMLHIVRGDQKMDVAIPIPAMGSFADGWPDACDKSKRIVADASRLVLDAQQANGRIVTISNVGQTMGALLLLATGESAYMDAVRRAVYHTASREYAGRPSNSWSMGYAGIMLAEYYLATGDDSVLEELQGIVDELVRGQMKSGSWGHRSPGRGYGALNQPGVTAALALVLARECGVSVDETALQRSLDFFSRFAQTGSIAYGDHMPGGSPDNNGTSASGAVLMHLAGRHEDAMAFARSVALYHWGRERGHTGGFWSIMWGPLGAALAGEDALQTFMHEQTWYYNLSRTWQGGFVLLPYHEALTRFDGSTYITFGPVFSTGGIALAFVAPDRRLRILGAQPSVFSPHVDLHASVQQLRDSYLARDWASFDSGLASLDETALSRDVDRQGVLQLRKARKKLLASIDHTIMEIESHIDDEHGFLAKQQFEALQRAAGEAADARFAALEERFSDGGVAWNVREGERFSDKWDKLKHLSTIYWTAPGTRARNLVDPMPSLRPPVWERLAATLQYGPQSWRTTILPEGETLPTGWSQIDFDDVAWIEGEGIVLARDEGFEDADRNGIVAARRTFDVEDLSGEKLRVRLQTVRPAETRVYLNGQLVVDVVRGQRGGYVFLELDDSALSLLRPEGNVLAVMSTAQGGGRNRLDVGLDITRYLPQRKHRRIDRVRTVPPVSFPGLDDTLRVRDASLQAQAAFQAKYDAKPLDVLLAALSDPVAYIRNVAVNSLVDRGQEAIQAVVSMADDPDWRVRSAYVQVIEKADRFRQEPDGHESLLALLDAQMPVLIRLLEDEHHWVRVQASIALRNYGEQASEALPVLMKLLDDAHDWVRLHAIRTVNHITDDPAQLVPAAVAILQHPYSGYPAPRTAFHILRDHSETDVVSPDQILARLLHVLRHPPEGDPQSMINRVMDRAAELDPSGERLIPVLIEAASDATNMSLLRQNPRRHAIRLLGEYGDAAKDALPTLEDILHADEDENWHDDAREAIDAIRNAKQD